MKYNIRGDKMVVTKAIKEYIENKIDRINKYFNEDNLSVNVLVKAKKNMQTVEVTIPTDKFILRSEESDLDLYAAIDLVVDKLERQIRKNKTKLKKQNKLTNKYEYLNFNYDIEKNEEENNKIVKRKKVDTKPMDEEEAILEMELLGHNFFVYKDMHTNDVCIIYRRNDGNYGIIDTK